LTIVLNVNSSEMKQDDPLIGVSEFMLPTEKE